MARILIVEDDHDFMLALRTVLEAQGFETEEAFTAEQGLEKVVSVDPDAVILDVMLPAGREGFEIARIIREKHGLTNLPIVILTSLHQKQKVPYRFAPDETYLPVDVFLDKSADLDAIVETIKELLGERREEPRHSL
jgi:two-component system response regulator MprA